MLTWLAARDKCGQIIKPMSARKHQSSRCQTEGSRMAYEIQYLRPTLSNSASHPPNKPQGVLEPWTKPIYCKASATRRRLETETSSRAGEPQVKEQVGRRW